MVALALIGAAWAHPWTDPTTRANSPSAPDPSGASSGQRSSDWDDIETIPGVLAWSTVVLATSNLAAGPLRVPLSAKQLGELEAVATVGGQHLLLETSGSVWRWGSADPCIENRRHERFVSSLEQVPGMGVIASIATGPCHAFAIGRDGALWAWGRNDRGQLGDGTTVDRWDPVRVGGIDDVVAVAAGDKHSVAIRSNGDVWAWGDAADGQLGLDAARPVLLPRRVSGVPGAVAVAAGARHSIALSRDGIVWSWGRDRLTDEPTAPSAPHSLVQITNVTAIAARGGHNLALRADGSVWAWGDNGRGQADPEAAWATDTAEPAPVNGLTDVAAIATEAYHSLALRRDGSVWTWGIAGPWSDDYEYDGMRTWPYGNLRQIPHVDNVRSIAAGLNSDFALTTRDAGEPTADSRPTRTTTAGAPRERPVG